MKQIKVTKAPIEGLYIIEPTVHGDSRGYFTETYNRRDMEEAGLNMEFVQDNQSMSVKGVLRGLHFQKEYPQGKLVRVIRGRVFDVAVDLRRTSSTYGKWYGIELSAENKKQFYISEGFAHGFLVLSDEAEFCYKVTDFYHPGDEGGIAWNDPAIGIKWPEVIGAYHGSASGVGYTMADGTPLRLSDKDQLMPTLENTFTFSGAPAAHHTESATRVDVVCPLYHADHHIDLFLAGLAEQKGVDIDNVVFAIKDDGKPLDYVISRIERAGYSYFKVPAVRYSESTTRERAIRDYCAQKVVVMMAQDTIPQDEYALRNLVASLHDDVVFAYGKQSLRRGSIERYVSEEDFSSEAHVVSAADVVKLRRRAYFASDAFSAYHRPTFLRLGGYGEDMGANQDLFYAKRVLDAGYKKAYVPSAVVKRTDDYSQKQVFDAAYDEGVWLAAHPEFEAYRRKVSTGRVFFKALLRANIPALFRLMPDIQTRRKAVKLGRKDGAALVAAAKNREEATRREVASYVLPADSVKNKK